MSETLDTVCKVNTRRLLLSDSIYFFYYPSLYKGMNEPKSRECKTDLLPGGGNEVSCKDSFK